MTQPERIYLDAREMEHPLPLEHAIAALRELGEGNYFYMLHRKNPIPLIELAKGQHLNVYTVEDADHLWHILICMDGRLDLKALCDV